MTGADAQGPVAHGARPAVPLALFESLFTSAPVGLGLVDREFRYLRVNQALAVINDVAPDAHLGRHVREIIPELWGQVEALYHQALRGETVSTRTVKSLASENHATARHFLVSYAPVADASGICGVGILIVDVTEARRFKEALRVRSDLYRMMAETNRAVQSATTRTALLHALCQIAVETGRFGCAWVGVRDDTMMRAIASAGQDHGYVANLVISLDPADPTAQGPTGQAALVGHTTVVNDFLTSPVTAPWHDAAREAGFAASAAFPLFEGGRVTAVLNLYSSEVGFFTSDLLETLSEMTPTVSLGLTNLARGEEQRLLAAQLLQAQKMEAVGQLASGVAHDFNNILTVINGCSELLADELPAGSSGLELVDEIREAGRRAHALTRQLLAFSRQQVVTPRPIDLNEVLASSEQMIRRLIGADIALTRESEPALGQVTADPSQIEQILLNLAVNARDAMPAGGELAIRTREVTLTSAPGHRDAPIGEFVALEVADTGEGMDAATLARLFEPFFTTKAPGKGTGLGLATVHRIVQDLAGHVRVESTLGQGTIFQVFLPRTAAATPPAPRAVSSDPDEIPRGSETILLVEDDDALRQLVRMMLRQCGYTVLEASNGAAAVTMAKGMVEPIHLLVSDVVMPHLGGRQLADVLLAARPECRVLFLSGYNREEMVRRGVVDSPHTFLQKPFTVQELAQQVRLVLDHPR